VLTAVKLPVLTAVKPVGAGLCVEPGGRNTPLSSLFERGLSWILVASGPAPGAGEKRWAWVGIGGIFSILIGPAG
jgi:hypothetical protein